ncbi:MAG TPA: YbbR-like domain-containing protein [Polyangiaceae bacterium]
MKGATFKNGLVQLTSFLRAAFIENLGLKVFSLALALSLFAVLRGQQERQQRTIPVAVILRLPPESAERELMTPIPANVHATLRGSTRSIDQLIQSGVPPIEVDLRGGNRDVLVFDPNMLSLPRDVDVTIIDPPSIRLEWQSIVTRRIPLQASITGKPTDGYVVKGELEVDPQQVTVRGPASLVEVMQFVRLAAFDVSGLTEGVHRRRVAMDSPPSRVSLLGPTSANVSVTIARRVSEIKFANRPIELLGVTGGFAVPRTVDVTIVGPPEVVRALRPEQVVPRVQLPQEEANKRDKHGSLALKVFVDLAQADAEVQPPTVTVRW